MTNFRDTTTESPLGLYRPDALPPAVRRYLEAQKDTAGREAVADAFAPGARVVDENTEYVGGDAIRRWLTKAASEFTYTTTFTGQAETAADRQVVVARLEGDFPGGLVDLHFRFRVEDDLIAELIIEP
ncbi:nuclear transport factor 2 family protein [Planctomonas deserti]|uniref:nuclear transport factor 2 family protein n=1 Tax=Planctomonas deserti TaxID=2144185 RepID=UPI000D36FE2B|nr:nuclear transport factor 2 family protein [Planctomonas deserti]